MTAGERGAEADRATPPAAPAAVLVVAADDDQRTLYEAALRTAQIPGQVTVDADEAEARIGASRPDVLVLDRGLPRLVVFRLFSVVRAESGASPVPVVFVGQGGDPGPGDHYLPGEPSAFEVAERVCALLACEDAAPPPEDAPGTSPAEQPAGEDPAGSAEAATAEATDADTPEPAGELAAVGGRPGDAPASVGAVAEAPSRPDGRLDVILIRIGLLLLILGALLILIQSDAFPPTVIPGAAPVAPTRGSTVTPKPGAVLDHDAVRAALYHSPGQHRLGSAG